MQIKMVSNPLMQVFVGLFQQSSPSVSRLIGGIMLGLVGCSTSKYVVGGQFISKLLGLRNNYLTDLQHLWA